MRLLLFAILFVSFNSVTTSQFMPGAKQIAMSHSDVALSNDVFAIFNNPAGLSQMNWRELGLYYSPFPFGLTELSNGFMAYHEPFEFGSIGFGAMTYGFELYRENTIAAGYSHNYSNKFFIGGAITFHTVTIKNYGSDNTFYMNLGGLYYLTNSIRFAFMIYNLNRASFGNEKNNIPIFYRTGLSYDVTDQASVNFAIEKDILYNYSLRGGIEYNLLDNISLRTGFSNEPSQYSAGIGINYSYFSLDYAFFTHTDLGFTHQAGLIISFGAEGNRNDRIRKYLAEK